VSTAVNHDGAQFPTAARQASGSSFYAGMRVLPRAQREAMYEIYAFCRAVDDVADEGGTRPERLAGLKRWRDAVEAVYAGRTTAATVGLLEPIRRFRLARVDFLAIIDGMEMDGREDIRAPDEATLDLYCDRVASAVGRLSVKVFGVSAERGEDLAHHLGRALQLTNILRDLDEDADMGRLYLPRELLDEAGIRSTDPKTVLAHPALPQVCLLILARARAHFDAADALIKREKRSTTKAPRLMGAVYRMILAKLEEQGFAAPRTRVKVPKGRLVLALLRHGIV
jgi:presqualene diphosphate synthase